MGPTGYDRNGSQASGTNGALCSGTFRTRVRSAVTPYLVGWRAERLGTRGSQYVSLVS
jgi:hypothetical protein